MGEQIEPMLDSRCYMANQWEHSAWAEAFRAAIFLESFPAVVMHRIRVAQAEINIRFNEIKDSTGDRGEIAALLVAQEALNVMESEWEKERKAG